MKAALALVALLGLTSAAPPLPRNGRIAFVISQRASAAGVASVTPTGTGRVRLASGNYFQGVASPDGTHVALVVDGKLSIVGAGGRFAAKLGLGASPTWAPDGTRLAYVAGDGTISIVDADGRDEHSLGVTGTEPVWSPDGEWIAYFRSLDEVDVVHPEGSGATTVTTGTFNEDVVNHPILWSHDGAFLLVPILNEATHLIELDVVRPDGTGLRSLGPGVYPAWSPTRDVVAFDGADDFTVEAADGTVLATLGGIQGTPVWSPSGGTIAVGTTYTPGLALVDTRTWAVARRAARGPVAWSPDGRRFAYISGVRIFVDTEAGGPARTVGRNALPAAPIWLGDGRIVYPTAESRREVIETASPGGPARPLVRSRPSYGQPPTYESLAWSPDGKRLAFVRSRMTGELEVVSADGTGLRVVARREHGGMPYAPTWSPDGKRLAFASDGIAVAAVAGGPIRMVDTQAHDASPEWSPDGTRIAFLNEGALYVVRTNGRGLLRLAADVYLPPSWSPDGRQLVFGSGSDSEGTAISTIDADGTGLRTLESAPAADEGGEILGSVWWSPDGKLILFEDDTYECGSKCDDQQLDVERPDGTGRRTLGLYLGGVSWSPDGRWIVGENGSETLFALNVRSGKAVRIAADAMSASWQPLRH
jgi:Tol biopolymer transport system component